MTNNVWERERKDFFKHVIPAKNHFESRGEYWLLSPTHLNMLINGCSRPFLAPQLQEEWIITGSPAHCGSPVIKLCFKWKNYISQFMTVMTLSKPQMCFILNVLMMEFLHSVNVKKLQPLVDVSVHWGTLDDPIKQITASNQTNLFYNFYISTKLISLRIRRDLQFSIEPSIETRIRGKDHSFSV